MREVVNAYVYSEKWNSFYTHPAAVPVKPPCVLDLYTLMVLTIRSRLTVPLVDFFPFCYVFLPF